MDRSSHSWIPVVAAMAAMLLAPASGALAQAGGHGGGPGGLGHGYHGGGYMYFDPDSIVTLAGTVILETGEWEPWGHGNHTGGGMGYEFLADDGVEYELMLAPDWYLEELGVDLGVGDRVVVTASVVDSYDDGAHHGARRGHGGGHGGGPGGHGQGDDEHDYLIVVSLQVDGVTIALRDDEGYPLWRGGPDWDHTWFDPDTVTTLTGTMSRFAGLWSSWGHGNHTGNGMHYVFRTDDGDAYYAMLGPWWFLDRQGIEIAEGERASIRGSRVESYWSGYQDKDYLIAIEITMGDRTVRLRDEWGYPLWHGTGWHYYSPEWDQASKAGLTGVVDRVRRLRNGRQLDRGYEVMLRANGRRYRLFVAPDWEVDRLDMRLRRGETIHVRGSLLGGRPAEMVVQWIRSEDGRWRFRTPRGLPRWVRGDR